MKKIFSGLLGALLILVSMSGCAKNEEESRIVLGESSELSSDQVQTTSPAPSDTIANASWDSGQFQLENIVIQMKCNYTDIVNLGWSFDPDIYGMKDMEIQSGMYLTPTVFLTNGNDAYNDIFAIGLTNFVSLDKIPVKDCQIWSVQMGIKDKETYMNVILPGNITWGSDEAAIKNTYGEPDETTEDKEAGFVQYKYTDGANTILYLDIYENAGLMKFKYECY